MLSKLNIRPMCNRSLRYPVAPDVLISINSMANPSLPILAISSSTTILRHFRESMSLALPFPETYSVPTFCSTF
jgi:hypothetical protein